MKRYLVLLLLGANLFVSCKEDKPINNVEIPVKKQVPIYEFGFNYDEYIVIKDTIKKGESFGEILDRNHIEAPTIYKIAASIKDTLNIRRLRAGKPYTILAKKDSTERAQFFIYQHNKIEYLSLIHI